MRRNVSETINKLFDLKDRVAIVTGSARGIGKEHKEQIWPE
jgi:hypothetical protein